MLTVIAHGMVKLMPSQEAHWIQGEEYPLGYDEAQSITARLNLLSPFKPRADLVVVGTAYAPPDGETERLVARVRVGDFSKALTVTGDRLWLRDGGRWGSSPPRPFRHMLLVPERAIRSAENPVGLDPASIPVEGRLSLPNFEPASGSFSAVLGPVPPTAPSRRGMLTPQGVAWVTTLEMGRAPGPLPPEMNFAFFNLAPMDQQIPDIAPGAAIVLESLHPVHSIFTSRLPPTVPRVTGVDPGSGRPLEPALRCDTLWIDAERELAWVVYRGTVDLLRPDLPVALSCTLERPQRAAEPSPMSTQTMLTTQSPTTAGGPGLPFPSATPKAPTFGTYSTAEHGGYYGSAQARPAETQPGYPQVDRGSYPPPPPVPARRSITAEIVLEPKPPGLPFGEHPTGEWDASDLEATHGGGGRNGQAFTDESTPTPAHSPTAPPPPPSAFAGLPFAHTAVGLPAVPDALAGAVPVVPEPPARARLMPKGSPGPIPDIGPTRAPDLTGLIEPPSATLAPPAEDREAAGTPFVAPPTIALPTLSREPERTPTEQIVAAHVAAPYRAPQASGSYPPPPEPTGQPWSPGALAPPPFGLPSAQPDPTPEAPAVERDSLTLEECARVRAALSVRGADKGPILASFRVSEATWARVEREALQAIDEGTQSGDNRPLERYDDAFVAAQDELRGRPVDGPAYARIQVARELKQLAEVLEQLGVGRNDLLRLDRVWRRRLASDKALAEQVEDEMERLRHGAF